VAEEIKTEAVILRSLRYRDSDRIVHAYTPKYGQIALIARGARKTKARLAAYLEPLAYIELSLRKGRGDLFTVITARSLRSHHNLHRSSAALSASLRNCEGVAKLFADAHPNESVYNLLLNSLILFDQLPELANLERVLAFRIKLLVASGLTPHLNNCSSCNREGLLERYSAKAGGLICVHCSEADSFKISKYEVKVLKNALEMPLRDLEEVEKSTNLRLVERAINETALEHAHVRLKYLDDASIFRT